jgi:hypothetical protein
MKTERNNLKLLFLFFVLFQHCLLSYSQKEKSSIISEDQIPKLIRDTTTNLVLFKKWKLDIIALKLIDSIELKSRSNIWEVGKEPGALEQTVCSKNFLFPVINDKDTIGYLKIVNESIVLLNKIDKKQKWQANIPTIYGENVKSILLNDSLYIAIYSSVATGSSLICLNASSDKNIWNGEVKGLNISHDLYKNEVFIHKMGDRIIVAGEEAGGNLLQVIDYKTGKNLFFIQD